MATLDIDKFLSGHVWGFLFIFSRIGCMLMLLPGIGEHYVPARMRLAFAFAVTFILLGPLLPRLPAPPTALSDMARLLTYEIVIGLFFGTLLRILLSALEAAGTVIALQGGLSNAQILNPALAVQSTLPSSLLSVVGITMLFVTGLDHTLLHGLARIYDIFPPGGELMPGDMAQTIMQITNRSFTIGIELAMPFFVIGLLFYIVLGVMQKLMPNVQLFLVVMPAQIWVGLILLAVTLTGIITVWLRYFDSSLATFLAD